MQRPQSSGGISAGMEFLKVNIFKEKEGGERERGKNITRRSSNTFFSLSFFSEEPCLGFTEGKATEDCWGMAVVSVRRGHKPPGQPWEGCFPVCPPFTAPGEMILAHSSWNKIILVFLF